MSWGFPPKYTSELNISSREKALVLLNDSFNQLNWKVSYIGHNGILAYTKFSFASYGEEITIRFDNDKVIIKSQCIGSQLWDWGRNEKNIRDLVSVCKYLSEKTTEEDVAQKFSDLNSQFSTQEIDTLNAKPQTTKDKFKNVFSLFIPTDGYFITPILLNINIILFVVMCFSGVNALLPDNQSLITWGANFKPVTLEGQWWRLFTCCFLHIGIFHLLMNMYALIYIGILLEPHLGRLRFSSAYLLTGLGASLASLWWNDLVISAGASGAIFGLYGIFGAMLTTNLIEKSARKTLLVSISIFVGYNLLNGLKGGIDNAAHIGGLITGLFVGYAYYPSLKIYTDFKSKILTVSTLAFFLTITGIVFYSYLPHQTTANYSQDEIKIYQEKMKRFANLESMAMEIYQKLNYAKSKEDILKEIQTRSLYYWNENIDLVKEADKLKLPEPLHAKNRKILEYCNLRVASMNLLYKTVDENTDKYKSELEALNIKIQNIVNELTGKK